MKLLSRIHTAVGAVYWLGLPAVLQNLLYRAGLVTGHYRRVTPPISLAEDAGVLPQLQQAASRPVRTVAHLPDADSLRWLMENGAAQVQDEVREILDGKVRLYGADPVPMDLNPHTPPLHWTRAQGQVAGDIKDIWEPARLGWVFPLGRAYRLNGDERCSQFFWDGFETFQRLNPYNIGPNWASGQEAALRIMAMGFAWQVFEGSPHSTPERKLALAASLYEHARRIPPTLPYARSQNNNHLVSEAVGLLTAGWLLPELPESETWQKHGWCMLNQALETQIAADGTYMQQSVNYHRLMLEDALWAFAVQQRAAENGKEPAAVSNIGYTQIVFEKLAAAARWLAAQVDPLSGACPNLGANDGAHILPLASGAFTDYRPTAQAAFLAFCGHRAFSAGPWDEQCVWLGIDVPEARQADSHDPEWQVSPGIHRLGNPRNWASLRAVRFHARPSQADQLHVELWRDGINIALDAGTYRYNAAPPWDNALAGTQVHNTVTIDGQDQMKRAGRFLWLDWAQARLLPNPETDETLTAEHDGYRRLGITHRRSVQRVSELEWLIRDELLPSRAQTRLHQFTLHWLVPDWAFEPAQDGHAIRLLSPLGPVDLCFSAAQSSGPAPKAHLSVLRAGQAIFGPAEANPVLGWRSVTYSKLEPALSIQFSAFTTAPLHLQTRWILPS